VNFSQNIVAPVTEVAKSQDVRLLDVFVIGPFLVWAATQTKSDVTKAGLFTIGFATILYNARNYIATKESMP